MAMRHVIAIALSSFACLTIYSVALGQVPHTFVAGTPARAAEVNENFQNLDGRISNNATDIARLLSGASVDSSLMIVDALGNVVGPAITFSIVEQADDGPFGDTIRERTGTVNQANILFKDLTSGKVFRIGLPNLSYITLDASAPTFRYTEPNCQGTPYYFYEKPPEGFEVLGAPYLLLEDGTIATPFGKGIYYPTSDSRTTITTVSAFDGGIDTCVSEVITTSNFAAYDGYIDFEALHPPPYRLAVN